MFEDIRNSLKNVNESKLLMGCIMILLNVASKYVEIGFSKTQEQALRNGLGREILIFAITFTGTRDIILSIILTASFIILSDVLFHDESKYCIMTDKMKEIRSVIDANKDGIVSSEEEQKAFNILSNILKNAEKQRLKGNSNSINNSSINNNSNLINYYDVTTI
jgi:hypothetical protein